MLLIVQISSVSVYLNETHVQNKSFVKQSDISCEKENATLSVQWLMDLFVSSKQLQLSSHFNVCECVSCHFVEGLLDAATLSLKTGVEWGHSVMSRYTISNAGSVSRTRL